MHLGKEDGYLREDPWILATIKTFPSSDAERARGKSWVADKEAQIARKRDQGHPRQGKTNGEDDDA